MSDPIIAALIGAGVALIGILLRDIGLKVWEQRRATRESAEDVFRRYADPLVSAAASLLWRLNEILNQKGRGSYLLDSRQSRFAEYKRLSTSYRIAAMLGWIRAFRRELSFLRPLGGTQLTGIRDSISAFEAALADGEHLEIRRLEGLLDLWRGNFAGELSEKRTVAAIIDQEFREVLHTAGVDQAVDLEAEQQKRLCRRLANLLATQFEMNAPTNAVLHETSARAMECLTLREAWLYRDWQGGIGDLMTVEVQGGSRRFDVIGYAAFETMFGPSGKAEIKPWAERLMAITKNLDVSGADRREARVEQLRNTFEAASSLILAIAAEDSQQRALLSRTLDLAESVMENHQSQATES